MKKSYNLSGIMSRAWSIRKNAAEEIGCKVSEVIFSECLKMAWAEAEGQHASTNAAAIVNEWQAMSETEQRDMVKRNIRKAAKNEIGYSTEDHYLQFSEVPAFGLFRDHDFDEFISESYLRILPKLADIDGLAALNERRASQHKRPIRLVSVVYNAARASIAAICYGDSKHSAAYDFEISDEDGNAASYLETMCGDKHQDTERAAIIRAALKSYSDSCDDIGRQVLQMVIEGKTEREIGKAVGMSGVAVHKRIVKMREALKDLRAA